ncbi:MAG: hypothetical protein AB7P33_01015 [Dehalococcoidia bacterium]
MKGVRQNWLESKLAAAEAEVNRAAASEFNGSVPPEYVATIAGAAAGALEAIETIPALDKLWGFRGEDRKALGVVRVFTLHLISTWLANSPELPQPADSAIARKEWAARVLRVFGMESDQNLNQFQMRDVQTAYDHQSKGQHLVSVYLLLSDLMRALGDETKGPLVQAKTVPLSRFDDLIISPSFRDRVSSIDITAIRDISVRSRTTCSEVFEEHGGRTASLSASKSAAAYADEYTGEDDDLAMEDEAVVEDEVPEAPVEATAEAVSPPAAREEEDVLDASLLDEAAEAVPQAAAAVSVPSAAAVTPPVSAPAPTPVAAAAAGPITEPNVETFEFEGELQALTFAEDGVGIVSVYDESVPVWRDLGFARGEVQSPEGLPLRIAVNLSLRTAVEAMEENTRRQFERMDDAQLNRSAAAALVPMEHQFLRPLACPRCGNHEHLNLLQQEAIAGEYHPDISMWPFTAPGGDRYTLGCPSCDFLFEVVFWFYE